MKSSQKTFYLICDNIRSLENIGSIFRTADALGVDKIFLAGICGTPPVCNACASIAGRPHPKISKTALGAEKNIGWEYHWQIWRIIDRLKRDKVKIVSLEQTSNSVCYTQFQPKFPLALAIGNEVKGVSKSVLNRSDAVIHLPMRGKKESLNVAVAFGAVGYYLSQFRNK